MHSSDPLSPIFLISLPLVFIYLRKTRKIGKQVILYCFLGYLIWYLIPRTGGGRFILPYLPAYSLAVGFIYEASNLKLKKILLAFVFLSAGINLGYRALANYKYLPVILSQQSKNKFLSENLNFNFGDFYDVDGYFQRNIDKNDLVLIYGVHNLYYVDFPYIHESWAKPGIPVTHILVKDGSLPEKFGARRLIYKNNLTGVNLYLFGENLP